MAETLKGSADEKHLFTHIWIGSFILAACSRAAATVIESSLDLVWLTVVRTYSIVGVGYMVMSLSV